MKNATLIYLNIACIVHFLGISIILLLKRNNIQANKMLSFSFLALTTTFIDNLISYCKIPETYPYLIHLDVVTLPLFAPFFYFYVCSMTGERIIFKGKTLWHLLPGLIFFLFFLPERFNSFDIQLNYFHSFYSKFPFKVEFFSIVVFIQIEAYVVLSIQKLKKYAAVIKSSYSDIERINLKWLYQFMILIAILNLSVVPVILYSQLELTLYIPLFASGLYMILVWKSVNQPMVLSFEKKERELIIPIEPKKNLSLILSEELGQKYKTMLEDFFFKEKPYLNPELSIKKLAEDIKIQTHHLSWVINEKFECNFFDFINKYRVEEMKEKLMDERYKHIKIEEIAYSCGFNSKATFNRVFKKYCNLSPGEFQKQKIEIVKEVG